MPAPTSQDLSAGRFELLSRVADDLAHEIKNPLHAMVINLEVLKRRVMAGDVPAALDRAAVLEEELRRVNELVNQLLLLMRPPREGVQPLEVDRTVAELVPMIEALVKVARRPFDYRPVGTAVRAYIRRDSLAYALAALTSDAIQRSAENAAIVLESTVDDDAVRIRIFAAPSAERRADAGRERSADTGPGGALGIADAILREDGATAVLDVGPADAGPRYCINLKRANGA